MIEPDDTPLTEEDRKIILGGLAGMFQAIVDGMKTRGHKSPPASYIEAFYLVAMEQGLSVEEYAARAERSISTMSRHLLDIGDRNRKMKPGLGLVTARANPLNRRRREYFLTPRGRALLNQLSLADSRIRAALEAARARR
jgi:DNA-binding MarR family transcriptional regulator